jgi:hypothetical protein
VGFRLGLIGSLAFAMAMSVAAQARDFEMGGDGQYPYSIMAPEPGTAAHRRAASPSRKLNVGRAHEAKPLASRTTHRHLLMARGSPGVVLPTPLPRTQPIPPEGGGIVATHPLPQEQGPTFVPSAPSLGAVPNLSHGPETFQDRASRCSFQQGLYGVPGTASSQYMGACVQ